jgi:hypothetical protein
MSNTNINQRKSMSENIDKLELAIDGLKGLTLVGEKVMRDGKIDFSDAVHIQELYSSMKKVVEAVKAYNELGEEIKDIDSVEAVQLITKLFS